MNMRKITGRDRTRYLVRERDNFTCMNCRRKWRESERQFDVHHLHGLCGVKSRSYDKVNDMPKLITLCHDCHMNLHTVRDKMSANPRTQVFYRTKKGYVVLKNIYRLRQKGFSYDKIGRLLNMSQSSVYTLYKSYAHPMFAKTT